MRLIKSCLINPSKSSMMRSEIKENHKAKPIDRMRSRELLMKNIIGEVLMNNNIRDPLINRLIRRGEVLIHTEIMISKVRSIVMIRKLGII